MLHLLFTTSCRSGLRPFVALAPQRVSSPVREQRDGGCWTCRPQLFAVWAAAQGAPVGGIQHFGQHLHQLSSRWNSNAALLQAGPKDFVVGIVTTLLLRCSGEAV